MISALISSSDISLKIDLLIAIAMISDKSSIVFLMSLGESTNEGKAESLFSSASTPSIEVAYMSIGTPIETILSTPKSFDEIFLFPLPFPLPATSPSFVIWKHEHNLETETVARESTSITKSGLICFEIEQTISLVSMPVLEYEQSQ